MRFCQIRSTLNEPREEPEPVVTATLTMVISLFELVKKLGPVITPWLSVLIAVNETSTYVPAAAAAAVPTVAVPLRKAKVKPLTPLPEAVTVYTRMPLMLMGALKTGKRKVPLTWVPAVPVKVEVVEAVAVEVPSETPIAGPPPITVSWIGTL